MHFKRLMRYGCLFFSLAFGACLARAQELPAPKSPAASLKSMQPRSWMKVELVASEPLIADPVAFDWGPDGSLWVAEMGDYPNGATWSGPGDPLGEPGGRIKRLTDTNGDGTYDRATLFLDKVPFPTGVKAWRGGVLVSAAPSVFYAEDTDDDGVADKRETLFEGFAEGNQQHRVNGLRWGLDNWLYLANGDSGGTIKSVKSGKSIDIRGRDLRIRPDTGDIEAISGQTQSGRNRDDWGNWFGGNNSNPMWHYALDDAQLRRNPHFAPPGVRHAVSNQPGAAPIFPTSRTLARFNDFDKTNRFTSACSPIIYRDDLLYDRRSAHAFICEPVHNLVHREAVTQSGATFSSRRAVDAQDSEFLASSDNWFRPTMVRTGPDGALWIADMYRLVIEHPEWIPIDWQKRIDLRAGHDRGRIYRVYPTASKPRDVPGLAELETLGLVDALTSPNGWVRDTAQQMLLWRNDDTAVAPLQELAKTDGNHLARLHALCTLDGLDKLDAACVASALQTKHPGLRRHAVRLAAPVLNDEPRLAALVAKAAADEDDLLRVQVAYALGSWNNTAAEAALAELLLGSADAPYVRAAAMSSLSERNIAGVISAVAPQAGSQGELLSSLLTMAAAFDKPEVFARGLKPLLVAKDDKYELWQLRAINAVLEAASRRKQSPEQIFRGQNDALLQLARVTKSMATDDKLDVDRRVASIGLLGRVASRDEDFEFVTTLLQPRHSPVIQAAAVTALTARDRRAAPRQLLTNWQTHTPRLRNQILDALLSRTSWTMELLNALDKRTVATTAFDAARRQALLQNRVELIRTKAATIFASPSDSNRKEILKKYAAVAKIPGDAARGKAVFQKVCAACHRLDGVGKAVGPELSALTDKSPQALLAAILDPNRAVEDKYKTYAIITKDGRSFSGMILEETGNSIKLAGVDGKEHVILRTDVDEMAASLVSLMPNGMERELPGQGLPDVLAFIRGVSSPAKTFPGNTPQVAPVRNDGSIRCFAMHARVYGPNLVFEDKYRNLGFWASAKDHAIWSLDVPKAGRYRVTLDYACANATQGNAFVLAAAGETLRGTIAGSGTWDDYRSTNIGQIDLPAGLTELTFRSDGEPRQFLLDLRTIRLTPK